MPPIAQQYCYKRRAPEALKNEVADEAKRIGISTNALMLQILDEWRRKKNERKKETAPEADAVGKEKI